MSAVGIIVAALWLRSTSTPGNSLRAYSATASVGDFLSISLDPAAHTLAYTNIFERNTGTFLTSSPGWHVYIAGSARSAGGSVRGSKLPA